MHFSKYMNSLCIIVKYYESIDLLSLFVENVMYSEIYKLHPILVNINKMFT